MAAKSTEKISFEESILELEKIVNKLEDGEVTLDESLALFERGIKLSARANKVLDDAEQKVNVLLKDKSGNVSEQEFTAHEDY